jgi:hypothetical protein
LGEWIHFRDDGHIHFSSSKSKTGARQLTHLLLFAIRFDTRTHVRWIVQYVCDLLIYGIICGYFTHQSYHVFTHLDSFSLLNAMFHTTLSIWQLFDEIFPSTWVVLSHHIKHLRFFSISTTDLEYDDLHMFLWICHFVLWTQEI